MTDSRPRTSKTERKILGDGETPFIEVGTYGEAVCSGVVQERMGIVMDLDQLGPFARVEPGASLSLDLVGFVFVRVARAQRGAVPSDSRRVFDVCWSQFFSFYRGRSGLWGSRSSPAGGLAGREENASLHTVRGFPATMPRRVLPLRGPVRLSAAVSEMIRWLFCICVSKRPLFGSVKMMSARSQRVKRRVSILLGRSPFSGEAVSERCRSCGRRGGTCDIQVALSTLPKDRVSLSPFEAGVDLKPSRVWMGADVSVCIVISLQLLFHTRKISKVRTSDVLRGAVLLDAEFRQRTGNQAPSEISAALRGVVLLDAEFRQRTRNQAPSEILAALRGVVLLDAEFRQRTGNQAPSEISAALRDLVPLDVEILAKDRR
uniref:Uncharacterized protein n=1 Tax=Chromera velia CCMP2878 TaxID=1169474 RepID=A0A0G4FIH2_9ALVE|eukprot:Cvel_17031.t1-p1 / transcript=Cvel_17031.t1 / gene=Cvel_17031 / organism=Chromera_velia_CCMP2878 / gene_product=hypothetical protein / transcript_product=hypothetical protein / location=Cvel_scaffold1340:2186-8056(-) / protein_length=374 / sequence_SO=supercontig / SO=protein_coding / is_pseudo=false